MQRKLTIECIYGDGDPKVVEAIEAVGVNHAVKMLASMLLLGNAQVVCYSDDFMVGRTEIDLMARRAMDNTNNDEDISDELLEAAREMGKK